MTVVLAYATFVGALLVAIGLARAGERARVPATVTLVACGIALGSFAHVRLPFAFGPTLLFVLLPPLVFEAAWNIDMPGLRAGALRIALLAFPGTLLTAAIVALALISTHVASAGMACVFGAIVCATDPVAVVATFRRAVVPAHVRTIAEAESLANDGVAIALYGIAVAMADGASVSFGGALASASASIVVGTLLGAVAALPVIALRVRARIAWLSIASTCALAYASYDIALLANASGVFATAAAALGTRVTEPVRARARVDLDVFWEGAAFLANAVAFFAAGILIDVPRAFHEVGFVGVGLVALLATRFALASVAGGNRADRVAIFLAGMRGGLPLALALALPVDLPRRATIVDGVFATVLATLVVQGLMLDPILRRFAGPPPASSAPENSAIP